jgi:hypothetical protein
VQRELPNSIIARNVAFEDRVFGSLVVFDRVRDIVVGVFLSLILPLVLIKI